MKPLRWTKHALDDLAARDIPREEAERALASPDRIVEGRSPRIIYQRRYHDALLGEEMLLRVVIEESKLERVVVTLYKTSVYQIRMKATYDRETDTLTIVLRDDQIRESDEVRPGVIADFGYDGGVVRFEIPDASKQVGNANEMQFAVAG
jgi:uncharacterized protein YuzE